MGMGIWEWEWELWEWEWFAIPMGIWEWEYGNGNDFHSHRWEWEWILIPTAALPTGHKGSTLNIENCVTQSLKNHLAGHYLLYTRAGHKVNNDPLEDLSDCVTQSSILRVEPLWPAGE